MCAPSALLRQTWPRLGARCRWLKDSRWSHEAVRQRRQAQAETGLPPLPDAPPVIYPGCHVFVVSCPPGSLAPRCLTSLCSTEKLRLGPAVCLQHAPVVSL